MSLPVRKTPSLSSGVIYPHKFYLQCLIPPFCQVANSPYRSLILGEPQLSSATLADATNPDRTSQPGHSHGLCCHRRIWSSLCAPLTSTAISVLFLGSPLQWRDPFLISDLIVHPQLIAQWKGSFLFLTNMRGVHVGCARGLSQADYTPVPS